MSSLTIRRIIVWVVSMILGLIVGYGIITVVFDMLPLLHLIPLVGWLFEGIKSPQGISLQEYGIQYYLFTSIPIGLVFVIWLDAFMDTRHFARLASAENLQQESTCGWIFVLGKPRSRQQGASK